MHWTAEEDRTEGEIRDNLRAKRRRVNEGVQEQLGQFLADAQRSLVAEERMDAITKEFLQEATSFMRELREQREH